MPVTSSDIKIQNNSSAIQESNILSCINYPIDTNNNTALHLSVAFNDHTLSCLLLLKGANPNAENKSGITPTMSAKRLSNTKLLKILKQFGGKLPHTEERIRHSIFGTAAVAGVSPKRTKSDLYENFEKLGVGIVSNAEKRKSSAAGDSNVMINIPRKLSVDVSSPGLLEKQTFAKLSFCENVVVIGTSPSSITSTTVKETTDMKIIPTAGAQQHQFHDKMQSISEFENDSQIITTNNCVILQFYDACYLGLSNLVSTELFLQNLSAKDKYGCTALMKAAYNNHIDIVKKIIDVRTIKDLQNAVNIDEEDNMGMTALTWACINGNDQIVRILLELGGANIDGARTMRRSVPTPLIAAIYSGVEELVWYIINKKADINLEIGNGINAIMVAFYMKKKKIVKLLHSNGAKWNKTTGEFDNNKLMQGIIKLNQFKIFEAWKEDLESIKQKEMCQKDKLLLMTAEDLDYFRDIGNMTNKASKSNNDIRFLSVDTTDSNERPRSRRKSGNRDGMNFEKLFDQNSEVMGLSAQLPTKGTILDELYISVFSSVMQLIITANKNQKNEFVAISAKAIYHASEIIRAIEDMQSALFSDTNLEKINLIDEKCNGIYEKSPLLIQISEATKLLNTEDSRNLLISTRIAVGVWPPPNAISEMIKTAAALAKSSRKLTMLANIIGFFPLLGKDLMQNSFQSTPKSPTNERESPNHFSSFSDIKRQNKLQIIEEATKQSTTLSAHQETPEEPDLTYEFFQTLDNLVKQFVTTVSELKKLHTNHLKEEFLSATTNIVSKADAIIEEIKNFEVLGEIDESLMLEYEDLHSETVICPGIPSGLLGKLLPPDLILPTPIGPLIDEICLEVKETADEVLLKGALASGVWPPPSASNDMLTATIPCAMAVKRLIVLAKHCTVRIRNVKREEISRKEMWKKECFQNEKVKQMFKLWDNPNQNESESKVTLSDEESNILSESTDGIILERGQIRGGRLVQIIERMTSHVQADLELVNIVLLTHHSITTSIDLLNHLVKRYSITPPYGLEKNLFHLLIDKKIVPIRLNVSNVIKIWLEKHFDEDFSENIPLILKLREFISKKISKDFESVSLQLMEILNRKLEGKEELLQPNLLTETIFPNQSKPILPKFCVSATSTELGTFIKSDARNIFEIDPLELARQLTLAEFNNFVQVKPFECTDQIWGEKRKKEMGDGKILPCSGIMRMIRHTNNVMSQWIASNIVSSENIKIRAATLRYFMQLALHCRDLNNYNGITGVVAGMSMAAVTRLKKTWQLVAEKFPKIFEAYREVQDIVSPKSQYANYRKQLKNVQPPLIPFLGVYLTDLTFIELGNPDFIPNTHYINIDKRRKVYSNIHGIAFYQSQSYHELLFSIPSLQEFLERICGDIQSDVVRLSANPVSLGDDEMYERSLIVEPREEDSDDEDADEDD
ncbi:hypothetical protein HK098_000155 [Nowakowskiella sp. JEL0407]|nr:hypothetical protein HK098_000155 [Nowakowskiella sp. JEL0407]